MWSIHNLATRRPHAVPTYSPVLTAAVCYVLTEKATVITTNLQASVHTHVSMSSDGNVTVSRWRKFPKKKQVKCKRMAKQALETVQTAVKFN